MAKIDPPTNWDQSTRNRHKQRFYDRAWKGRAIAQRWPSPHPRPLSERQQAWIDDFSLVARMTSRAIPKVRQSAEYYFNDKNWYWRDSIAAAAHGKFIMLEGSRRITTPTAHVRRTTTQNLGTNTFDALIPTEAIWDNYTWWNPSSNPTRLTAKEGGLFLMGAEVEFNQGTTGNRHVRFLENGITNYGEASQLLTTTHRPEFTVTAIRYLEKGTFIEVTALASVASQTAILRAFWIVAITPESLVSP